MVLLKNDPFRGVEIWGAKEVQECLGVSHGFVKKIIAGQLIPCKKIAAGWIFPKDSVLKFQAQRVERAATDKRIRLKKDTK